MVRFATFLAAEPYLTEEREDPGGPRVFPVCSPRRSRSSVEARPGAGLPGCGKVVVDSMYAWNRGGFFFFGKRQ